MVDERTYKTQKFPVYYSGVSEFKLDGKASGLRGAVATVEIGLNNRPHEIVGVRIRNSYARFPTPTIQIQDPAPGEGDPLPAPVNANWAAINDGCCLLEDLDDEQTVQIDLAQQNVIIRNMHQRELCGKNGIHWHPFPCSYPFRGGNNMFVQLTRLQSYPFTDNPSPQETVIKPTAFVTVFGWMYVSDELPPGGPPSTDFNEPPQGASGYR
jgi:hypothetical protein